MPKCIYCDKEFVRRSSRQKACSLRHDFNCPTCGEVVKNRENRQRNVPCRKCGYKKGIETVKERYGVHTAFNLSKSIEKRNKIYRTPEHKEKMRNIMIEKYGVDNYTKTEEYKKKREKYIEENGYSFGWAPSSVAKREETLMRKYGVKNIFQLENFNKIYSVNNNPHIENKEDWNNIEEYLLKQEEKPNIYSLSSYFNVNPKSVYRKVKKLKLFNLIDRSVSSDEIFYKKILDELNVYYIIHDRTVIHPLELDFYIPDFNLAIEINPTWTHKYLEDESTFSPGISSTNYHYNKFKACSEKGIELISIFDWTDTNKVIKFIKDKLNKNRQVIYARNCSVNIVPNINKQHKELLEDNHVLGKVNNIKGSFTVELNYNNELVGLGIFYPYKDKNTLELKRLCFKEEFKIIGGASKIIKNGFRYNNNITEIITFSDNDLGTGNVYKKLGFEVIDFSKGNLIWSNPKERFFVKNLSLVKQGTDRLLKNFPNYKFVGQGENLPSNQEIIQQYGFYPIYDCGYTKWKIKR